MKDKQVVWTDLCRKSGGKRHRASGSCYWEKSAAKGEGRVAGVGKTRRSKLYAVLFRVSLVWSPARASVTGAREAPVLFFNFFYLFIFFLSKGRRLK